MYIKGRKLTHMRTALTLAQVRASTASPDILCGCRRVYFSPFWWHLHKLTQDVVRYNAKVHPHLPKLKELLRGLSNQPKVVVVHHDSHSASRHSWDDEWTDFDDFVKIGQEKKLGRRQNGEIEWTRLPFDWPLWILFSSGTTGTRLSTAK